MALGTFDRNENIARLSEGTYDVLVIGGGITGAGVALDAASRGLRAALVERDDFASGTSSKSSKLIHGGLRYLQNGDVRLVYEALRERQRLLRNAPHLVRVLPFLIPVFEGRGGIIPKRLARALGSAMWMYDLTGGLRIGKRHRRLRRDAALAHMPTLGERLAWAYLYYDAQADDARLTLAVARTAALDFGATVVNHAAVTGIVKDDNGRAAGAVVDTAPTAGGVTGQIEVRARVVINATGVWADDVRALDEGTHPRSIRPAKGIHIAVPWHKLCNDIAAVVPVRQDRRSVFVVPWLTPGGNGDQADADRGVSDARVTYIGTTDTDYDGEVDDPQCTPEDVAYLLDAINHAISEPIEVGDVLGTWAGLRPLVRDASNSRTADLSRRHRVFASAGGMITVTGGKLTTYREMAEDAVNAAVRAMASAGEPLPRRARRSHTRSLALRGAAGWREAARRDAHLGGRYGGEAAVIEAMTAADPTMAEPLVLGLPYRRAEALYAVRYEMATTVDDVLSRRTRSRLLGRDATAAAADDVAALLASELGWSEAERAAQVDRFRAALEHEREVPGLPEHVAVTGGG
ncbi:MAG TPA: glycerol-3-phosphate dehydrogenase/oxidase [Acidimicrobiales bacterium]|jgi:glycerol-3-phosphate dehydrogenase|nr:glycerol-3-phosphate dehydrogenase/oxidase [Acidimicrobiales bacterium]